MLHGPITSFVPAMATGHSTRARGPCVVLRAEMPVVGAWSEMIQGHNFAGVCVWGLPSGSMLRAVKLAAPVATSCGWVLEKEALV